MKDTQWKPSDAGILKITNSETLQRWKDNGEYQKLINQGYIYAFGCGRFRIEICKCNKCRKYEINNNTNT